MNENPNQPQAASVPASAPLQFEKAEFVGEPLLKCTACKAPIADEYYQVNGQNVCSKCRANIQAFAAGGSKITRFGKAAGAGIAAGVGGFLLYFAVLAIANIHLGLIAIAVGWMVGSAVRWGSNRIGGPEYQVLAVLITYVSICSSYIPIFLRGATRFADEILPAFQSAMTVPWREESFSILRLIIMGFGLLQAWQMNRKITLQVTGPFFTRQTVPPTAT